MGRGTALNPRTALPKTNQENSDFEKAVRNLGLTSAALDGNDVASEGTWRDSDGQYLSFTKWKPGQPNGGTGENYLMLEGDQYWWDRPPTDQYYIVCEKGEFEI